MTKKQSIEESLKFTPKFDKNGLLPAIAQGEKTGEILMVAYMNKKALDSTIKTGLATYYSRSRKKLWRKGEQSGHVQKVKQILTDCDQDCILMQVSVNAGQCHTGYKSCFYRELKKGASNKLRLIAKKTYNPEKVYKK